MKPGIPWSVKGIEPELREIAKSAARRSGLTLGEWLNSAISEQADEAAAAQPAPKRAPARHDAAPATDRTASRLDDIAEQLSRLAQRETATAPQAASSDEQYNLARILTRVESNERQTVEAFSAVNDRLATLGRQIARGGIGQSKPEDSQNYKTLEKAIHNIVEHLEVSDRHTRENMKTLQDRLSDMASRLSSSGNDNLLRQVPAFSQLEARISELATKVEQPRGQTSDQLRQELNQLSGRIDGLRETSEALANRAQTQAVQASQAELRAIEGRIVSLLNEARQSINANNAGPAELEHFRQEIERLNSRVDTVTKPSASDKDLGALKVAIEQLSKRVDNSQSSKPLDDLDRRVLEIAQKLERAEASAHSTPHTSELERRLAELDQRVAESLRNPLGDTSGLVQKLAEVDSRLAGTERQIASIATIERAIAQLYDALEQTRNQQHDIAHSAALRLTEEMNAKMADTTAPEIAALQEGLAAVREATSSAEKRNQETLEAVTETLTQVVGKLTELEAATQSQQYRHQPAPPPQQPHYTAPMAEAPAPAPAPSGIDPFVAAAQSLAAVPAQTGWGASVPQQPPAEAQVLGNIFAESHVDPVPQQAAPISDDGISDFVAAARKLHQAGHVKGAELTDLKPGKKPKNASKSLFGISLGGSKDDIAPAEAETVAATGTEGKSSLFAGLKAGVTGSNRPRLLAAAVLLMALASYTINQGRKHAVDVAVDPPATNQQSQQMAPQAAPVANTNAPAQSNAAPAANSAVVAPAPAPLAEPSKPGPDKRSEAAPTGNLVDPIQTGAVPAPATALSGQQAADLSDAVLTTPATFDASIDPAVGPAKVVKAATSGDATAQFVVASHYLDGDTVLADFSKAAYWYGKAAASGSAPAQYRLATMYERGKGVERNLQKAMTWYEKAATAGNIKAMHNVAVLAAGTDAGPPDYAKALTWFTQAAQHGLKDSQFNLAVLLERGLGTKADLNEALFWYMAAAAQNDSDAKARVDDLSKTASAATMSALRARLRAFVPEKANDAANRISLNESFPATREKIADRATGNLTDEAKRLLTKMGYRVGEMDGQLDPRTAIAIKLFQIRYNMQVTGEVTPELIQQMQSKAG